MIDERVFLERIQAPLPSSLPIVPVSFPVTSFGDVNRARVLTVGLNPSSSEFMTPGNKSVLGAASKRLVDREMLGVGSSEIPSAEQAQEILRANNAYFTTGNHYKWFDKMEETVLRPMRYSYFDGTAAHVDVLQWATHPLWSGLEDSVFTSKEVQPDIEFLQKLFAGRTFDFVLFNGRDVYNFFRERKLFHLHDRLELKPGSKNVFLWTGHVADSPLLSWSTNVPDHHTSADSKRQLSLALSKFGRNDGIVDPTKPRGSSLIREKVVPAGANYCPVCDHNLVHGRLGRICRKCVTRLETPDGSRVSLGPVNVDGTVRATYSPSCSDAISEVQVSALETGDELWVDGIRCHLRIIDDELFEVLRSGLNR